AWCSRPCSSSRCRSPRRRSGVRRDSSRTGPTCPNPCEAEAGRSVTEAGSRAAARVCEARRMQVHLVDGTYELFRQYLAPRPGHLDGSGTEVGATRAVVASMLTMLEDGATHLGVATDHVIESFRNDLWETYKTGEGIDPLLREQFPILEDALTALGVTVWPMVEYEADDA